MKLEDQVVSLGLAKQLKKLMGQQIEQAYFWYYEDDLLGHCLDAAPLYPAFTVAELGEMLPARLTYEGAEHSVYRLAMEKQDTRWNIVYVCAECGGRNFEPILADTEADARAKMLIYLLENNLITV